MHSTISPKHISSTLTIRTNRAPFEIMSHGTNTWLSLSHRLCPLEDNKALLVILLLHMHAGFSAKLAPCQLTEVEKSPAHLTTLNESFGQMFMTHTPKFLGLNRSLGIWPTVSYGDDVIIGVFDTGIWPESESFNDDGMSNIPLRWRGKCQNGTDFTPTALCNNKLIGAQSFRKGLDAAGISISSGSDFDSPRDFHGHGTHTSSIAGGNFVCGASHFGYAKGVAIGIAPRAHLAMYKVIWFDTPASLVATDILAGMDQAISDGVDVMSISLGLMERQTPLYEDVIAIAAFSAIEKGIVVVCAAGNDGPVAATIYNAAPWIMTVGAGTIDRNFIATLELGNGLKFQGTSYFPSSVSITNTNIYYEFNDPRKSGCSVDLDPSEVKGKIVLCDDSGKSDISDKMYVASHAGAYGAIFLTKDSLCLDPTGYSIPAICVHTRFAKEIKEYSMEDNASVKKMRFVFTKTSRGPAPQVASLSSRGPDPVTPNNVLKPDMMVLYFHNNYIKP
ncbi:subtilisin-like protease SBT1.8 [Tanacetum coccineum]